MNTLALAFTVLVLAGCATRVPTASDALVPPGEYALERVPARGVQIYECRSQPAGPAWVFVAPEADLLDKLDRVVGKHGAGPRWQAADGSAVVGSVKARLDAPQPGTIPWLLLTTRSDGKPGRYAGVTSIQRLNTAGGAAPTAGCDSAAIGRSARVPYTADYVLFTR